MTEDFPLNKTFQKVTELSCLKNKIIDIKFYFRHSQSKIPKLKINPNKSSATSIFIKLGRGEVSNT